MGVRCQFVVPFNVSVNDKEPSRITRPLDCVLSPRTARAHTRQPRHAGAIGARDLGTPAPGADSDRRTPTLGGLPTDDPPFAHSLHPFIRDTHIDRRCMPQQTRDTSTFQTQSSAQRALCTHAKIAARAAARHAARTQYCKAPARGTDSKVIRSDSIGSSCHRS